MHVYMYIYICTYIVINDNRVNYNKLNIIIMVMLHLRNNWQGDQPHLGMLGIILRVRNYL